MGVIRVAVVGLGRMGCRHVAALAAVPGCRVISGFDLDHQVALAASRALALPLSSTLDDALRDVDLVVVATPTATHVDVASHAVRRGLHVFVEKPLARDADQARRLLDRASATGASVIVGMTERFNPAVVWMRRHLEGTRLLALETIRIVPVASLRGTGATGELDIVTELAIHDIDLLTHLSGAPVTRLAGCVEAADGQGQQAFLDVDGAFGVRARVQVAWRGIERRRRLLVTTTAGRIAANLIDGAVEYVEHQHERSVIASGPLPLDAQAAAVVSMLDGGPPGSLVLGREALALLEVIERSSSFIERARPWSSRAAVGAA